MNAAGTESRYVGASGPARALGWAAALAAVSGLLAILWLGLAVVQVPVPAREALAAFDVSSPPPLRPEPLPSREPEGAAAPPAPRAVPAPVAAPEPVVPLPEPAPAPPVPAEGAAARAGAAEAPGPGSGAGGDGQGLGSGEGGGGTGSGVAVRARRIRGGINIRDFPRAEALGRATQSLILHLSISAEGRVTDCVVARSSGNARLDAITCRLAQRRFRYVPARDATGRPVPDVAGWRQEWWREP